MFTLATATWACGTASTKAFRKQVANMVVLRQLWRVPVIAMLVLAFMAREAAMHKPRGKKALAMKVNYLTHKAKKEGVIRMSTSMFHHYVLQAPSNYSVIVLFTVVDKFTMCSLCTQAAKAFQLLVSSWQHPSAFTTKVFFALVDYRESPEVFQRFQVRNVPNFFYFSDKRILSTDDILHVGEKGITAEQIAEWVAKKANVHIAIRQPVPYGRITAGVLLVLLGGCALSCRCSRKLLCSNVFWAAVALHFVIVMTSGLMWVQIRGASFGEWDSYTGQMRYIAWRNSIQVIPETYLVSLLYMCITLGMVLLDKAATCRRGAIKTTVMCVTGMGLIVIFFGCLLSLFKFKQADYPYGFTMD
ncbi:magnesium transporter protein 1-like [Ochotona princeps]|uniref:magnesium transporter protein 1-like n=1 Tax=Ochotona princeps TaxID=9978 RepID=UPI002714F59C|nr:magnesium transporter protein 1-like [Ochotona princeps]